MTLLGCSRSSGRNSRIVNGVPYEVLEVTSAVVIVKMVAAYRRDLSLSVKVGRAREREEVAVAKLQSEIVLTHDEASRWLRLPYALTYRNCQGITARDKRVMLTSLDMRCFDVRSLIVGSSRVTSGSLLFAPTEARESRLLRDCPPVDSPPEREASEAADSDADSGDEWAQ